MKHLLLLLMATGLHAGVEVGVKEEIVATTYEGTIASHHGSTTLLSAGLTQVCDDGFRIGLSYSQLSSAPTFNYERLANTYDGKNFFTPRLISGAFSVDYSSVLISLGFGASLATGLSAGVDFGVGIGNFGVAFRLEGGAATFAASSPVADLSAWSLYAFKSFGIGLSVGFLTAQAAEDGFTASSSSRISGYDITKGSTLINDGELNFSGFKVGAVLRVLTF